MTLSLLTFMVNPTINKRRRNTINKMDNWSANIMVLKTDTVEEPEK